MKTMKAMKAKITCRCLNFKHIICITMVFAAFSLSAADQKIVSRKPAAVDEEVLTVPLNEDSFFTNDNMFAEDDAGIMKDMKATLKEWEVTEEYARVWDIESTGLYNTPSTDQKKKYISKKMLRYADKRLAGEMRNADEGSTLRKVGNVEKQLRPNASVNVSKNFGLKFKARVLQGKAIMEVKNPWIECNATVSANCKAKVITRKEFKSIGFASGAEYSVNESQYLAYIDQQVTDNIKARVSSTKEKSPDFFSNDADARVEMTASFPFNL